MQRGQYLYVNDFFMWNYFEIKFDLRNKSTTYDYTQRFICLKEVGFEPPPSSNTAALPTILCPRPDGKWRRRCIGLCKRGLCGRRALLCSFLQQPKSFHSITVGIAIQNHSCNLYGCRDRTRAGREPKPLQGLRLIHPLCALSFIVPDDGINTTQISAGTHKHRRFALRTGEAQSSEWACALPVWCSGLKRGTHSNVHGPNLELCCSCIPFLLTFRTI